MPRQFVWSKYLLKQNVFGVLQTVPTISSLSITYTIIRFIKILTDCKLFRQVNTNHEK